MGDFSMTCSLSGLAISGGTPVRCLLLTASPYNRYSDHLSMCLADKLEVPRALIDTIAELTAVRHTIAGIGVLWKPAASTGPSYPEWDQHLRFARTLVQIAQAEDVKHQASWGTDASSGAYATLAEVPR